MGGGRQPRPSILIVAYECSPVRGHAPGAAWNLISRLSRWNRLVVVTEETQYRSEIEDYVRQHGPTEHLVFHFVPSRGKGYVGTRPVLPVRSLINYRKWLRDVAVLAQQLNEIHRFDVVHHLRGNSFREPGYLWHLDVPFIWGPVGGTGGVSLRLLQNASSFEKAEHLARNLINWVQFRLSLPVRRAANRAAFVIAQTEHDERSFRQVYRSRVVVVHEQNADVGAMRKDRSQPAKTVGHSLRALWVGQCISRKGFPIVVDALSLLKDTKLITVDVVGDGPSRPRWEEYAGRRGVGSSVRWLGWKSRESVLALMERSDVLLFTSLLEGTPATVMEAISKGLPVICIKHCGHGDIIDQSCGVAIDPSTYADVSRGFARAIERLLDDNQYRHELSIGALEKARNFSWDRAASAINATYRAVGDS